MGSTGSTGPTGITGLNGKTGSTGSTGSTGPVGPTGSSSQQAYTVYPITVSISDSTTVTLNAGYSLYKVNATNFTSSSVKINSTDATLGNEIIVVNIGTRDLRVYPPTGTINNSSYYTVNSNNCGRFIYYDSGKWTA
jgi:hypothetical protein